MDVHRISLCGVLSGMNLQKSTSEATNFNSKHGAPAMTRTWLGVVDRGCSPSLTCRTCDQEGAALERGADHAHRATISHGSCDSRVYTGQGEEKKKKNKNKNKSFGGKFR